MEPLSISDELISYFESNTIKQKRGVIAGAVNPDVKNSTDIKSLPKR